MEDGWDKNVKDVEGLQELTRVINFSNYIGYVKQKRDLGWILITVFFAP